MTPPRSGWEPAGEIAADDLAVAARSGLEEVAAAVRERGAAAGFVRDRVWARDVVTGAEVGVGVGAEVRAGGAFAAFSLGFLAPGTTVQVLRSNRWTRLTAAGGHVLMR